MKRKFKILGYELTIEHVIGFIVTGIVLGLLHEGGKDLYSLVKRVDKKSFSQFFSAIESVALYKIQINAITLLFAVILFVPTFKFIEKKILSRIIPKVIFHENFASDSNYWGLNYWASTNPQKTNRIENQLMIFEATPQEWQAINGENGAYYDLKTGLIEGRNYEVSCCVKSSVNSTMGFQLWLHDMEGNNSIKIPLHLETPPSDKFKEYKRVYTVNKTKSMRIHLHCRAGDGYIAVKEVKVKRIIGKSTG